LSSSNRIAAPQLGQFISTDISDSANPDRQHPTTMAIRKDGRQLDCELRDYGAWGVEVQVRVALKTAFVTGLLARAIV
jgi:hypothetical protein